MTDIDMPDDTSEPNETHRTQQARTDESRRALIEAAISAIASLGITRATLVEIAKRAGVSRGLVNYQFESKNHLFAEVIRHRYETNRLKYRPVVNPEDPPAMRIERMMTRSPISISAIAISLILRSCLRREVMKILENALRPCWKLRK